MTTTGPHTIYVIPAVPAVPWETGPYTVDKPKDYNQRPWVSALDKFAAWAQGETTIAGAMTKVTRSLYAQIGTYDTYGGSSTYSDSPENTTGTFNLEGLLTALGLNNNTSVNCYDAGKSLSAIAGVGGYNASYAYSSHFGYLNCILPVHGTASELDSWTNNPFHANPSYNPLRIVSGSDSIYSNPPRSAFGNHAFTMMGSSIYDACLRASGTVPRDTPPPGNPPAWQPVWCCGDDWSTYTGSVVDTAPLLDGLMATGPATYTFLVDDTF